MREIASHAARESAGTFGEQSLELFSGAPLAGPSLAQDHRDKLIDGLRRKLPTRQRELPQHRQIVAIAQRLPQPMQFGGHGGP